VDWESLIILATVLSALCAVTAATVSVLVLRKTRPGNIGQQIALGDAQVKDHVDRLLGVIRATVGEMSGSLDDTRNMIARIEAHQASEEKHVLRPRDLAAIHEKVGRVAEELASTRAQASTETKMLSEQLRVLQQIMLDRLGLPRSYRS
jgi:hypothetical protein